MYVNLHSFLLFYSGGNLPYDGEAGENCTCGVPDGSFFFDTFTTTAQHPLLEVNGVDFKAAAAPLKGASYLRDPLVEKSGRVLQKGGGGGGGDKVRTQNDFYFLCFH